MTNEPSAFLVLHARAEARAILYAAGEIDTFAEAIAPLLEYAETSGLMTRFAKEDIYQLLAPIFMNILGGRAGHA